MVAALARSELDVLRSLSAQALPAYLRDLEHVVNIDSGSYSKPGVDRVVDWTNDRLGELGGTVERHPHNEFGATLVATFGEAKSGPTILMLAHADTVFDEGTVRTRPFSIEGERARGPGVYDMKGGLLLGLGALGVLGFNAANTRAPLESPRVVLVVNSDEEIGSPASTPIIEQLADGAGAALILEGARSNGDLVTARAGMMQLRITIDGRAAHAGVEPERGRSAILEAAHKAVALHALSRPSVGVTVNVGELHGGTRPSIVAEQAVMTVDLRARDRSAQEDATAAIMAIAEGSTVAGVTSRVETLALHQPMQPSDSSQRLLELAVAQADGLGFRLGYTATGGASDGNTTSAAGVPTLDGLGPVGGNAHTADEYLDLGSVVPRMALLAALLLAIGRAR